MIPRYENGSPGGDLNPRPRTYKARALTTTELQDNLKNGAEGGIRTHDDVSNPDYKSGAIDHYATSALLYIKKAPTRGIEPRTR